VSWIIIEFLAKTSIGCYFLKHLVLTTMLSFSEGLTSGSGFIGTTNIDLLLDHRNRFSPQSWYIIASVLKC